MDLFLRKVPKDKLHHNFKSIRNDESIKNVLQKWEEGFIDRDNKFVKEFQTTFNSSFWELYLNALLRSLNFNIDFSYNRPDFCVSKDGKEIVIEAVISNNPSNGIPEHDKISGMKDLMKIDIQEIENKYEEVIDLAVERILNSITNKHKLYIDKYRHLDHVKNKPFIIAIGAYEQPFFYLQAANAILKVLYGMDSARYEENVPVFKYKERILKKSNNSELNIGLFTDDRIKEVSAIIFSPIASIGKVRALADVKKIIAKL